LFNHSSFRITSPRNGDILNRHDGAETDESLLITVKGSVSGTATVTVNGVAATVEAGEFTCQVPISRRTNILEAVAKTPGGDCADTITVLWDKKSFKRFRFSIDDNIMFLKDLGQHPEDYSSLFDHWYLAFWQRMHLEYGTKVHINIYYQTEGFDLTNMPTKWRDQWQNNADWLHLSFHALANNPDRIYRNAVYTQVAHDFDLIMGHIRRFAGNEVTSRATTIHWAECPKAAVTAVRDRGIDRLIGLFWLTDGQCTTGYYHDPATCEYINSRDYWKDTETDLVFVTCDQVVNSYSPEDVVRELDKQEQSPHTCELIELLIHEQYFRTDLQYIAGDTIISYYKDDIQQRVIEALKWVTKRGYEPVFWGDGFCGNPTEIPA